MKDEGRRMKDEGRRTMNEGGGGGVMFRGLRVGMVITYN